MKVNRIIVTGASGSVGQSLIPKLLNEGFEVFSVGRTKSNLCQNIDINLSSDWSIDALPSDVDAIIHLAQSENFRKFPDKAVDVYQVNTISTLKLADFAVKTGVKKFIYASSGGIYGNRDKGFDETESIPTTDLGFYLGSKLSSEIILDSYKSHFDVIMARFFFVYGENQSKDMLIPRLIHNVQAGKEININGSGGIKINPIYVEDAVDSILKMIQISGTNKFNIAGDEIVSIKDLSMQIGSILNKEPNFTIQEGNSNNLIGDNKKMHEMLLQPKLYLNEGLKKLIESYGF